MSRNRLRADPGFTLVELLLVMGIVVCLCALLYPKIQPVLALKKNMVALNHCRAACDAYMIRATLLGGGGNAVSPIDLDQDYPLPSTAEKLSELLVPDFLFRVPELDPWDRPYQYFFAADQTYGQIFACRSLGANGVAEGPYQPAPFAPNVDPAGPACADPPCTDDIVCADGQLVSWPGDWQP